MAFENFRDFPNVESVEKMSNFETATFERIKPIVLGFVRIRWESGSNPRTIGLIRPKVAFEIFRDYIIIITTISITIKIWHRPYGSLDPPLKAMPGDPTDH